MRRLGIFLIVLALSFLISIGGLYAYQIYVTQDAATPAPTQALALDPAPLADVTAEGTIVPRRQATLAFKLGGGVTALPIKVGDRVQAGALIAMLDNTDLKNQVGQAEAALGVAQKQLAQARAGASDAERQAAQDALAAAQAKYDDAKKAKVASSALKEAAAAVSQAKSAVARLDPMPEAIAVAQARVDQAQVAYDSAIAALTESSLVAPFAGTVAQVNTNVGDFTGPGIPVVSLGDLTSLRVESNDVSDLDIGRVKVGQSVKVTLDALPGRIFHGTVAVISPVASESRGYKVFRVWIDLKEGVESGLRWGMDAKIEISVQGTPVQGE